MQLDKHVVDKHRFRALFASLVVHFGGLAKREGSEQLAVFGIQLTFKLQYGLWIAHIIYVCAT